MKPLLLQVKVKNNILWKLIQEHLEGKDSLKSFAQRYGLNYHILSGYLNLSMSPILADGSGYRKPALEMSELFGESPSDLFPRKLYAMVGKEIEQLKKAEIEMDTDNLLKLDDIEVQSLPAPKVENFVERRELVELIEGILKNFSPRERAMLKMRFGLGREGGDRHTFDETAQAFGVTRERVRQVEERVIREMGKMKEAQALKDYLSIRYN